jgi:hypothetical protein
VAGVGSTVSPASTALTLNLCLPRESRLVVSGDRQRLKKAPPSSLHWTEA